MKEYVFFSLHRQLNLFNKNASYSRCFKESITEGITERITKGITIRVRLRKGQRSRKKLALTETLWNYRELKERFYQKYCLIEALKS
jgi:hypothetical protein